VPEVRMTVEEYLDLLEKTASNVKRVGRAARTIQKETRPARRKAGKAVKGMAAALKKANAKARKKNGSFKKGYDQARVMRMAHQMRRRAL
jgi:t-SNARE complex subunit (syntaxin)